MLLEQAFIFQDDQRRISSRRFVAPSFNDIRLILNTAQIMSLIQDGHPQLVTFDGDVTLYDDGKVLEPDNPVIKRILHLLAQGVKIGIVTAAGYTEASPYYDRLYGLLDAVADKIAKKELKDPGIIVLGGESNFLFEFDYKLKSRLRQIPRESWLLDAMKAWSEDDIKTLLDVAEEALRECIANMKLPAAILRKERAVGMILANGPQGRGFTREQLEETVLVTQQVVEMSPVGKRLPFCAFNGESRAYP